MTTLIPALTPDLIASGIGSQIALDFSEGAA